MTFIANYSSDDARLNTFFVRVMWSARATFIGEKYSSLSEFLVCLLIWRSAVDQHYKPRDDNLANNNSNKAGTSAISFCFGDSISWARNMCDLNGKLELDPNSWTQGSKRDEGRCGGEYKKPQKKKKEARKKPPANRRNRRLEFGQITTNRSEINRFGCHVRIAYT